MLDEFCCYIVGEQVCDICIIIVTSLPSLKIFHVIAAKQWHHSCTAIFRIISYPGVFLVVTKESHNLTVLTFLVESTIGKICCPVLECCIILVCYTPLICHTPSVIIDFFGQFTCLPRIIIVTSGIISPDIYIYEVKVLSYQFFQIVKTFLTIAGSQIVNTVKTDCLIQPVPSITEVSVVITTYIVIFESFCFRIHLTCIYMDTKSCTIFCTFGQQCIHILSATNSLSDISIIRMCGIVTFICITF